MKKTIIIPVSKAGMSVAVTLQREIDGSEIKMHRAVDQSHLADYDNIVFIGALGICVRMISNLAVDKHTDPAVVCVDSTGKYAISVLSGHIGGGNDLCRHVASVIGAEAVITTQSDNEGLWGLDTLASKFGWKDETLNASMNDVIFAFVNGVKTALLLDVNDKGSDYLRRTMPPNVKIIHEPSEAADFKLLIAVTPFEYDVAVPTIIFRPRVLTLGIGCRKGCDPSGVPEYIGRVMKENNVSPLSLRRAATIELKKDEPLLRAVIGYFDLERPEIFSPDQLAEIDVPNPSEKVETVTGVSSVAESSAVRSASGGPLVIEKMKGKLSDGNDFTFAVAIDRQAVKGGHIEIVGAGPGDPELVSVRGRRFLEEADLILYAGSLVPRELTFYAKPGCVVRSSASMDLEEQFALMKEFYDRGLLVVRLHTGDPCIYGAIQEQMAFFDKYNMSYHITPGISSFQAAAAALRSQFTIPERVQTIILTRGGGRTPMPEKEQLHKLAKSQSTMCIYLSAAIVDEVQEELLKEYPPETPVAACYKLTWKEERIYRGKLKDLARIVHDNNLTLTTLLVVGEAIDNRQGLSKLYHHDFKHLFRR